MKVKELIELLTRCNQDAEVVMSCDAEGNGISPFSDLSETHYEPDSTWSGELVNAEDLEDGEMFSSDTVPAVCLWPTN